MQNEKSNKIFDIKKRSYYYAVEVINVVNKLPSSRSNNVIANQVIRSATSIGANLVEAQAASSKNDFIRFLYYSLKSSNECKFWLSLLKDTNVEPKEHFLDLINETKELANILGKIILTTKKNNNHE